MTEDRFLWVAAAVAVLTAGLPARAADPNVAAPGAPQAPPAQRVAIDPRTGMLADAPPAAAAAPSPAVRSAPLAGVRLQSGAVRVDLKGRYQMAVVARRDASGAITTACVPAGTLPAGQNAAAAGPGEVPREK